LGEDGPTHQAIEHTASLRLIPNMTVWRPCDTVETAVAWVAVLERVDGPTCLVLTRQNVSFIKRDVEIVQKIRCGGYVLADFDATLGGKQAVIIATGSEVELALAARGELAKEGIDARVVSMPCTSVFDRQDATYRGEVLPRGVPRVAVEAGATDLWCKYVGACDDPSGRVVGMDTFGESAPASVLFRHFGFTVQNVAMAVKRAVFPPLE